jgi:transposase InsO family protein
LVPRQFKKLASSGEKGPARAREKGRAPQLDKKRYISATAYGEPYCVSITLENVTFQAMIDSGAEGNYISPLAARNGWIPLQDKATPYDVVAIDGRSIQKATLETIECRMLMGSHEERIQLDVTPIGRYDIILGMPWLKKHDFSIHFHKKIILISCLDCNIVGPDYSRLVKLVDFQPEEPAVENTDKETHTIGRMLTMETDAEVSAYGTHFGGKVPSLPHCYDKFKELFTEGLPETALPAHKPWDHHIPLEDGKQPRFGPLYSLSEPKLKALREYLEGNLAKGFIAESQSPAGHPILFVDKPDGSLRLCVDYRALNEITIKNRYALPLIAELQDRIVGAKFFTKLDLLGAYNLIRMKKGEEWKTAFRTRYGHYEYNVMPFGLTNAPATFQAMINNALRPHLDKFVVAYLDDILIYSKTEKEHIEHVTTVLKALAEYQLKVRLEKSVFHTKSTEFLGYIVSTEGLKMQPNKVRAILDWPDLRNVKDVQQFLGLANYYRRFIHMFSGIVGPLTQLTRKETPFRWGLGEIEAFKKIKTSFTTDPVLVTFDPERKITVETDASDYAMAATISQPDDNGKLHPVAYYSRKFSDAERNYDIHDKELLAIVAAFKEWRVYLEGPKYPVQVLTDHKNLLYFTSTKELNQRQVRWSEELSRYNFQINYRKGSENGKADTLSRRPDYDVDSNTPPQSILRLNEQGSIEYNRRSLAATVHIETKDHDELIKQGYKKDSTAQRILSGPDKHPGFQIQNNRILFQNKNYVPVYVVPQIIKDYHEHPVYGHQGVEKTLARITENYYFLHARQRVEEYLKDCDMCRRTKSERHAPYGFLMPLPAPTKPWQSVTMDFIGPLPNSQEPGKPTIYDMIMVVVDRLTTMALFIPHLTTATAEETAHSLMRELLPTFGLPEIIISDRDKIFTSKLWQAFTKKLGIKCKLSSAYHPQTDGQTERTNQTLEQTLRCYLNYRQSNWVELLPTAQYAYNSSQHAATGTSPHMALMGYQPEILKPALESTEVVPIAEAKAKQMKAIHEQLTLDITFLNDRMSHYYNTKRIEGPILKEGDKVYLLRRNIKTTRPSDKLDHKKLGPYLILEKRNAVTYKLQLPEGMNIHPVFHVALLEPAPIGAVTVPITLSDDTQEPLYQIESIVDCQEIEGQTMYQVKWKGYSHKENTWEPPEHFTDKRILARYHHQHPGPRGPGKRSVK